MAPDRDRWAAPRLGTECLGTSPYTGLPLAAGSLTPHAWSGGRRGRHPPLQLTMDSHLSASEPQPGHQRPAVGAALLALDTGSSTVSVAIGREGQCLAQRHRAIERSSEVLIGLIDDVLQSTGQTVQELGGMAVLCGPGSFTGLRVGLATALGFRQALALPVTTVPTLHALAAAARLGGCRGSVLSVVDALRGRWFAQRFDVSKLPPVPLDAPRRLAVDELPDTGIESWVGFGISRAGGGQVRRMEPAPLAEAALGLVASNGWTWTAEHLTEPLYLQQPNVSPPKSKPGR